MKYLIVGDLHFGARNFNPLIAAWQERFFTEVFFPAIRKLKPDKIVQLGDVFDDHKGPSTAVIDFSNRVFFDKLEVPLICLVGNHDAPFRDSIRVNSLNMFGRASSMHKGAIEIVTDAYIDDRVLFLPWICQDNLELSERLIASKAYDCVLGHLELVGGMIYPGRLWDKGYKAEQFHGAKIISGHFHSPSEHYIGTPYDLTWAEHKDKKRMILLDTKTLSCREIDTMPCNLHAEVIGNVSNEHAGRIIRVVGNRDYKADESAKIVFKVGSMNVVEVEVEEPEKLDAPILESYDTRSAFFAVLGESQAMEIVDEAIR